jgi:hypothetical protein
VFSAYRLSDDTRIWIITEADRSVAAIGRAIRARG